MMTDNDQKQLGKTLRAIAGPLRGSMNADRGTLARLAEKAGLRLHESSFNQSLHPAMCGIDMRSPDETLTMYLEFTPLPDHGQG